MPCRCRRKSHATPSSDSGPGSAMTVRTAFLWFGDLLFRGGGRLVFSGVAWGGRLVFSGVAVLCLVGWLPGSRRTNSSSLGYLESVGVTSFLSCDWVTCVLSGCTRTLNA